jgi:hypothetical protein
VEPIAGGPFEATVEGFEFAGGHGDFSQVPHLAEHGQIDQENGDKIKAVPPPSEPICSDFKAADAIK